MKNVNKYQRTYYMPPQNCNDWVSKEYIDKAPRWCSVDLRDGNQALVIPMSLEEKLEFFMLLVSIGFKEIEVGFPAASETEFEFVRTIIEQDMIPDDVTIQVLTQAREHIINKTFEALKGAKSAVVHLYNSTSVAQREQVFRKTKEEIINIAINGAKLLKEAALKTEGNFQFEYSPESFTGTEMEYALDICNAVISIWQPTQDNKVIINLPATVECSMSHVYASQIEYMHKHLANRENVIISLHPHNDRGCGVADAELGLIAGADRIEGTLFGNGERTGNVDIITLAMNMFSHGIDPQLNFEDIPSIVTKYEKLTRMKVGDRTPYAGKLVFAAFSGSHQDAIAKGMKYRQDEQINNWNVPYLMIDPNDIGREYDGDVIRINSQSGKGGIGFIMETKFGFDLPKTMREQFGYLVKNVSDKKHAELSPEEILDIFNKEYINIKEPIELLKYSCEQDSDFTANLILNINGKKEQISGRGNGRLDAVTDALKKYFNIEFFDLQYKEHALETGSKSMAASYVGINDNSKNTFWGVGVHSDIMESSVLALISAINKIIK